MTNLSAQTPLAASTSLTMRPPLTRRHRRAAITAGILGLLLIVAGMFAITGIVVVAFFLFVVMGLRGNAVPTDPEAIGTSIPSLFWWSMVSGPDTVGVMFPVFVVGGIFLIGAGITVSGFILRARRVHRPWAVTWSAAGIATAVSIGLAILISVIFNEAGKLVPIGGWQAFWPYLGLFIVITLVGVAVVGSLTWWWMAHALRARAIAT